MLEENAGALDAVATTETQEQKVEEVEVKTEADNPPETKVEEAKPEDGEAPKKPTGFQRKLFKAEQELARKDRELAELRAKLNPQDGEDKEPQESDFDNWTDYTKAIARYEYKQEAKRHQESQRRAAEEQVKSEKVDRYTELAAELKASAPDFDEVVNGYNGPWNQTIANALLDSDVGPQVAYYLAKNPEEAAKMADMGETQLARFIGRIEAKLEAPVAKPAVKTTKAPPPIKPISGSVTVNKDPSEMSYEEYRVYRANRKS